MPPSGCTATTPRCRCLRRERPTPADAGSTCATIVRSAAALRLPRCSTTRAIAAESILACTSPDGRGCCRPTPTAATLKLYEADRTPGPILEAACWAHARRPFFALADIEASARRKAEGKVPAPISPLALETVRRIDALFEIERGINGKSADERRAVRQELSAPLIADLEAWMRAERPKLPRGNDVAKAAELGVAQPALEPLRAAIGGLAIEQQGQPFGRRHVLGRILRLQLDKGVGHAVESQGSELVDGGMGQHCVSSPQWK